MKKEIKKAIKSLEAEKRAAKSFQSRKSCRPEDRVHMEGFMAGIDYGISALKRLALGKDET